MTRFPAALGVLLAAVGALVLTAGPAGAAPDRTITYTVSTRGTVQGDVNQFAAVAAQTFADPRGWSLGGALAFQRVASGGNFDLILASGAVIAAASSGCDAFYSCRVGRSVYINDDRWRTATSTWPYGLATYQQYVIIHEVGHWLGMAHQTCPGAGPNAPVMQQQSISLQGCRSNMWPIIAEREQVGRLQGVAVRWSAVDAKYRAMGQERSILGPAVGWENPAATPGGRYQRFQKGTISYSPATGGHETHGDIDSRYRINGGSGGPLGYPTTDTRVTGDGAGRYVRFSGSGGSAIFWSASTGAREVHGPIFARWAAEGYERGALGYPTSDQYAVAGGWRNDFQHGYIRYDTATGQTQVVITG